MGGILLYRRGQSRFSLNAFVMDAVQMMSMVRGHEVSSKRPLEVFTHGYLVGNRVRVLHPQESQFAGVERRLMATMANGELSSFHSAFGRVIMCWMTKTSTTSK
jgi:hypothetical protein